MQSGKETYTIEDIYNLPEGKRAELIDGQIYYMSMPNRKHQDISGDLFRAIYEYIHSHKENCKVYVAPFAVYLDEATNTYVEPDISVICDPEKLDDRGCKGAPDWIIEIVSPESFQMDYYKKLFKYADTGVREYWIVNPDNNQIWIYDFENEEFRDYTLQESVKVEIFDDLIIDLNDVTE